MRTSFVERFCCPRCAQSGAGGRLVVASILAEAHGGDGKADIIDGIPECVSCHDTYPVVGGVALLVAPSGGYVRTQYESILGQIVARGGTVSDAMRQHLRDIGAENASTARREYYDAPRKISTYLAAHYDDVAGLVDGDDAFSSFVRCGYASFYEEVLALLDGARPLGDRGRRGGTAVDVGSYVGGFAVRLGRLYEQVIGVDVSFGGTLTARQVGVLSGARCLEYEAYVLGDRRVKRTVTLREDGVPEFAVGSGLQLPIRGRSVALACALNVLE